MSGNGDFKIETDFQYNSAISANLLTEFWLAFSVGFFLKMCITA